jgi:hypothetical protein
MQTPEGEALGVVNTRPDELALHHRGTHMLRLVLAAVAVDEELERGHLVVTQEEIMPVGLGGMDAQVCIAGWQPSRHNLLWPTGRKIMVAGVDGKVHPGAERGCLAISIGEMAAHLLVFHEVANSAGEGAVERGLAVATGPEGSIGLVAGSTSHSARHRADSLRRAGLVMLRVTLAGNEVQK